MSRVLVGLVVCSVLWGSGCSGDEPSGPGTLKLRPGKSLDEVPECSLEDPTCPAGTQCMSLTLQGVHHLRCFDGGVCTDWVTCTAGTECVVLEQFPAHVTCTGPVPSGG